MLPFFICIISCKTLPPSNGYIGNKLKIASNKFVYIIIAVFVLYSDINKQIIAIIKFIVGPANAIIIFFMQSLFPLFIFSL